MSLTPSPGWVEDEFVNVRRVTVVALPGMQALDATGPFEVFNAATRVLRHLGRGGGYVVSLHACEPGEVVSESGLRFVAAALPDPTDVDIVVIPGGDGVHMARFDAGLLDWVRSVDAHERRIATVCTGAFIAAAAGLLDGKRVTTHWLRAEQLASDYPAVIVDPDPIYLNDGRIWTSAGVTAGIDLALAMVEQDVGTDIAQAVARLLVMFLHRPGGQTQFSAPTWLPRGERNEVRSAQQMIDAEPGADHRIDRLAARAAMSTRHFARVFSTEVGETPGRYVEQVRVESARRALETTTRTLDAIAVDCGFGTAETLRRAFHRRLGVAPDTYRRRFRVVA